MNKSTTGGGIALFRHYLPDQGPGQDPDPDSPQDPPHDPDPHPVPIARFLRGDLAPAERARVVRHLLAGCPACQRVARRLWRLGELPPEDSDGS